MDNGIFNNLYKKYRGYIEINVYGFSVERFINLAVRNNIHVWDVMVQSGYVKLKVYVSDYKRLYSFAKKAGVRLKICRKYGRPFFIHRYRKRYVFVTGMLAFALLLCFMSSFIWLIEIEGNTAIDDYRIMSALNKYGLSVGKMKCMINTDAIGSRLKDEIDEISWINIELNGTRATVFVTEDIPDTNIVDNFSPCDIISDKEALITEIIANTGTPSVKVGDVVREGDVLISGDVTYTLDGVETLYKQVYSSGIIKGEVTRHFTSEVPYTVKLKRYTGKKKIFISISLFTTKFNTNFLKNDINWQKYDIIREVSQPTLGTRFTLPVISDKTECREYTDEYMNISEEEAKKLADKLINKEILKYYRTDDDIISKNISFAKVNGKLIANATVVSVENLGKTSYIFSDVATGGNAVNGATENTNSE